MMLFTFVDGLWFSLLSIGIVILIIFILVLAITPLKRLSINHKVITEKPKEKITMNDDMMAAILVASIDYRESEKKEPKLISIKELHNEDL
jgi:Na+-transporting methylmalonyl-CoA/oxaloacetate decarboxylase gamma subunit